MSERYIVLTGGDGGFGNLGDELLLRTAKDLYRPLLDRFTVVVAKLNPATSIADGFVHVREDAVALEAMGVRVRDVELVHYYGGGYLNDHWYDTKMRLYRELVRSGLDPGRVAFTGQGVGPLDPERMVELTRVAGESLLFGSRDRAGTIGRCGRLTFDDTIALYTPFVDEHGPTPEGPVALNLRNEHYVGLEDDETEQAIASLDRYVSAVAADSFAFGMVENASFDETVKIAGALHRAGARDVRVRPRPTTLAELVDYLRGCRVAITTSYHVALVSLYVGTPVIALHSTDYYRLKFDGLADVVASPLLRVARVDAFDVDVIEHVVKAGTESRFREDLHATLTELKRTNESAREEILSAL